MQNPANGCFRSQTFRSREGGGRERELAKELRKICDRFEKGTNMRHVTGFISKKLRHDMTFLWMTLRANIAFVILRSEVGRLQMNFLARLHCLSLLKFFFHRPHRKRFTFLLQSWKSQRYWSLQFHRGSCSTRLTSSSSYLISELGKFGRLTAGWFDLTQGYAPVTLVLITSTLLHQVETYYMVETY